MANTTQPRPSGVSASFGHNVMKQMFGNTPWKKEQAQTFAQNTRNILDAGTDYAMAEAGMEVDLTRWEQLRPTEFKEGPNPFVKLEEEEKAQGVQYNILHGRFDSPTLPKDGSEIDMDIVD
jgi:hypothetical protein